MEEGSNTDLKNPRAFSSFSPYVVDEKCECERKGEREKEREKKREPEPEQEHRCLSFGIHTSVRFFKRQ